MKHFFTLLKVDLLNTFGGGASSKRKNKKSRGVKTTIFLTLLMVLALSALFGYMAYNMYTTQSIWSENPNLLIAYFAVMSVMLSAVLAFQTAGAFLFDFKDFDILMALPVDTKSILALKAVKLYITNLTSVFPFLLGSLVVIAYLAKFSILQSIIALVLSLFFPLLPVAIFSGVSTFIMLLASKFKRVQSLNIILTVVFSMAFGMMISVSQSVLAELNVSEQISLVNEAVMPIYQNLLILKPVFFFAESIVSLNPIYIISYLLCMIIPAGLFLVLFSKMFFRINASLREQAATKKVGKFISMKRQNVSAALLKKEFIIYMKTPQYFFQTYFGSIMISIFLIAGIIFSTSPNFIVIIESMASSIGLGMGELRQFESMIIIFMFAASAYFVNLAPMSVASISVEGQSYWIAPTLPITEKQILAAKLKIHPLLAIIPTVLALIMLAMSNLISPFGLLLTFVLLIAYAVFISHLGLVINLFTPKLDWNTPAEIFKRSLASFVFVMSNLFFIIAALFLYGIFLNKGIFPSSPNFIIYCLIAAFILLTVILRAYINTGGVKKYKKIYQEA